MALRHMGKMPMLRWVDWKVRVSPMNICVVGLQWGDEGKGKVVDILAENSDIVVRYGGGSNAGHTVVIGDERFALHLLPSGAVRKDVVCVIANAVVVDPAVLISEIDGLAQRGITLDDRLLISENAPRRPGLPQAGGPVARGVAGQAEARHDRSRHRPVLRGQGGTQLRGADERFSRSAGAEQEAPDDPGVQEQALRRSLRGRADERGRRHGELQAVCGQAGAAGYRYHGVAPHRDRRRQIRPVRGRPRLAAGPGPRNVSLRDELQFELAGRAVRVRRACPHDRPVHRRGQGVYDPRGGGAFPDRVGQRDRPVHPRQGPRVWHDDGPAPPVRVVRRGRRRLQRQDRIDRLRWRCCTWIRSGD